LTNINVADETGDYREGVGCARFHLHSGTWETRDWLSVADPNLSSKFPGKNGTSNKRFSLAFWMKLDSLPPAGNRWPLVTKANWDLGRTTYAVTCDSTGQIGLDIGDGTSTGTQSLLHASSVRAGQWYHIGVTFDNATHTGTIRIWDALAGASLGTDAQKTNFPSMGNTSDAFMIGSADGRWYANLPGRLDEIVMFNDVLTAAEIAKIRAGTYGK
jgi:hypothetical protein